MSDEERIRELFLQRRVSYSRDEVRWLTGVSSAGLEAAVADGSVVVLGNGRLPWKEVAHLALEEWTPRLVSLALGDDAAQVLPLLNQQETIHLSLPRYLIRMLDHVARAERRRPPRDVSDLLEAYLLDVATSLDSAEVERSIPGFAEALQFPG